MLEGLPLAGAKVLEGWISRKNFCWSAGNFCKPREIKGARGCGMGSGNRKCRERKFEEIEEIVEMAGLF
jgi:hypothetical protein